ncbi:hydantoinase/oxoprolinase family protein [Streptomyces sp. PSKA54]|uniref:Hydantoinase/oxoprolinase family protein n=1 Tax=Streptomyces himalayensis subsp. aureolus TaxID=2758039 RepID=A0A7W2D9A2_9ACTN|nr:hydantoinase/oxoprolinase family protein [Streptomyces himalayensis]MBA4867147.1 hydantoinase/oxoprolinase family protein [Streptomyces himalayensis subsp. aureolus]
MTIHVGIDVGGTFTDAVAVSEAGSVRGKSLSTPDVTGGILGALGVLQQRMGLDNGEFFAQVNRFVLGNTIVTNAIDQMKFSKVGLLTTRGFKDTLRIARSARGEERDPHDLAPYPSVVERRHILEISERIDAHGNEIVPVDLTEVKAALAELIEQESVEAIAVCLLWSFRNPAHERAIGELIQSRYPDLPFTVSSELTPVYREYERMVTTVLDAAVKPIVANHFEHLEKRLREAGLRVAPQIMQVHGGFLSVRETSKAPINMFNSGPVGGVAGARLLGQRIGRKRILTADMGGTSLDAAAIIDGELRILPRARIGDFPTSLTAVDIESIGSGGGSIGWIDGRGLLRLGPRSAGSTPGPVCYGRGGTEPTTTDAALVMGLINPDYYLGGAMSLDADQTKQAVARLAEPLGLTVEGVAHGMYRLATHQMANAVRKITINRGHDPREFTMVNFGGAMGLFAASVAQEVGLEEIVVPANAAVFSAWGLMHADAVYTEVRTTPWTFDQPAEQLEAAFSELEAGARAWFESEEIPEDKRELIREADMKFAGQIFEVTSRFPNEPITEALKDQLRSQFVRDYESEFGTGTAWTESEVQLINCRVRALGRSDTAELGGDNVISIPQETDRYDREIINPSDGRPTPVTVYRGFAAVREAEGPCILEEIDTTVFVPAGAKASMNDQGDVIVSLPSTRRDRRS